MASASGKEFICLREEQRSWIHKERRSDCFGDPPCRPLIWGIVPVGAILKLRGRVVISIPTFDYVPFNVV